MKIGIYCCLIADILTKKNTEMFIEWSSTKHTIFVVTSLFDWLPWQPKGKIYEKNIEKINSSEAVLGIKLKLCRIVSNISIYKNYFYCRCSSTLLWQLKVSIDLQWEKWKLRFIAISLQIFWQKFYRNVCWVALNQAYHFKLNLWIWLVTMATERLNLQKKNIKRSTPQIVGSPLHEKNSSDGKNE